MKITDVITGKSVAEEIENELIKYRALSVGMKLDPIVVRDALKTYNMLTAYGISPEQFDEIIKNYCRYGLKANA